jgi:hypothetical protein
MLRAQTTSAHASYAGDRYTRKALDACPFAGQTLTLSFTGTEDSLDQTSFVIDDTALTLS